MATDLSQVKKQTQVKRLTLLNDIGQYMVKLNAGFMDNVKGAQEHY
jgi:hypothetical protein